MTEESHEDRGIDEETSQGENPEPAAGQGGEGGEGKANREATPPLKEQAKPGQTQVPAPDDDAGGQRGGEDRTD